MNNNKNRWHSQQNFQRLPQWLQNTKVVIGSSADRVCTWLYVHLRIRHFPHCRRSVSVPPLVAIWLSLMASLDSLSRSSFISLLAISSDVITARREQGMLPSRMFSRSRGFFESCTAMMRLRIRFLYLTIQQLRSIFARQKRGKTIDQSIINARRKMCNQNQSNQSIKVNQSIDQSINQSQSIDPSMETVWQWFFWNFQSSRFQQ